MGVATLDQKVELTPEEALRYNMTPETRVAAVQNGVDYTKLKSDLEKTIDEEARKREGLLSKVMGAGATATGALSVGNAFYSFLRGVPAAMYLPGQYLLVGVKTALELPRVYEMFKKKPSYLLYYAGIKLAALTIPVLGAIADLFGTRYLFKKAAGVNAVHDVLEKNGIQTVRVPFYDRLKQHVDSVTDKAKNSWDKLKEKFTGRYQPGAFYIRPAYQRA